MPASATQFQVFESAPSPKTLIKLEPCADGSVDLNEVNPDGSKKWALLRFKNGKVFRHRGIGNSNYSLDSYGRISMDNLT
jgi:hypothetical protein